MQPKLMVDYEIMSPKVLIELREILYPITVFRLLTEISFRTANNTIYE